jgi:hypothetical protein
MVPVLYLLRARFKAWLFGKTAQQEAEGAPALN